MKNGKIRDSKIRAAIIDFAKGDFLWFYWKLFAWYNRISYLPFQDILSFFLLRIAHKHGGYIGRNATFQSKPVLPHGLHGIYISRYAKIGKECHMLRLALWVKRRRRSEITVSLGPERPLLAILG